HSVQSPSAFSRQLLVCQAEPDGVNYHTPAPIAEGVCDHFHDHIIRRIYIRIDAPPRRGNEHPALHPRSKVLDLMDGGLCLRETILAGKGLLSEDDHYSEQLRLIVDSPPGLGRHGCSVLRGQYPRPFPEGSAQPALWSCRVVVPLQARSTLRATIPAGG